MKSGSEDDLQYAEWLASIGLQEGFADEWNDAQRAYVLDGVSC